MSCKRDLQKKKSLKMKNYSLDHTKNGSCSSNQVLVLKECIRRILHILLKPRMRKSPSMIHKKHRLIINSTQWGLKYNLINFLKVQILYEIMRIYFLDFFRRIWLISRKENWCGDRSKSLISIIYTSNFFKHQTEVFQNFLNSFFFKKREK